MRRVVITGVGLVTALGVGTELTWSRLCEGLTAVGPIRGFDASTLTTRIGAELTSFDPNQFVTKPRSLKLMTRGDQLAFAAATLALGDAGWQVPLAEPGRAALYMGGNKDTCTPTHLEPAALAMDGDREDYGRFGASVRETVFPLFYVEGLPGAALFFVSEAYNLTGANAYFAGTAEAGLTAIGAAYRAIRRGEADIALAGAFDQPTSWWNMSRIDALGILSDHNELGASACRPYDIDRSGSVLGDGAAILALEDAEAASRRGAKAYAEIVGFGAGFASQGLMTPDAGGLDVQVAARLALRDAAARPAEVACVIGHGSATRIGDVSEARGLREEFGRSLDRVPVTSVKAGTGHLVAGAGALNCGVAALALRDRRIPPTLNLGRLDPACDLDVVTDAARGLGDGLVLALSRGVEGQAAAILMRAPEAN